MVKAKQIIYAEKFVGLPKPSNFKVVEEDLPPIKDNEVLVEALFLSVDPYMRAYEASYTIGITMIGGQVAKVIESKNTNFRVGDNICGNFGWRSHSVFNPEVVNPKLGKPYVLPSFGNLPLSLGIGALGMPGNTAYFGFLEICQPKSGEVVVVSGAAGAVGSLVGQIAKIKGCTVIGIAGSDEKNNWLKDLGFDHVINYKTENVGKALAAAAPNGVDCYFDNVGGEMSSTVLSQMNTFGRVSVCGSISSYNDGATELPKVSIVQPSLVFKQLKMEGFIVTRWLSRWQEGIKHMLQWIQEGKIKYNETVTTGFENMPQAFIDMLNGKNTGKAVVKV